MTREEIQQAIANLSADERGRLRAWLEQFEAEKRGEPSETSAERFGRIAGRTFADLRKRLSE